MAKSPLRTYAIGAHFLIIGNNHITAFSDGDGIKLAPNADLATIGVGANGHVVVSLSSDDHYTAEITVMQDSADYALLEAERIAQRPATPAAIPRLSFLLKNTITGESWSTDFTVFTAAPELTYGPEKSDATFKLFLVSPEHKLPE